jgi:hypothetical protein
MTESSWLQNRLGNLISTIFRILQAAVGLEYQRQTNKQTPWPLVRVRTIPTERPPLVDEI